MAITGSCIDLENKIFLRKNMELDRSITTKKPPSFLKDQKVKWTWEAKSQRSKLCPSDSSDHQSEAMSRPAAQHWMDMGFIRADHQTALAEAKHKHYRNTHANTLPQWGQLEELIHRSIMLISQIYDATANCIVFLFVCLFVWYFIWLVKQHYYFWEKTNFLVCKIANHSK